MKIKTSELKKSIDFVKSGLSNGNDILDFSKYLFFQKDEIFAFNGVVKISSKFKNEDLMSEEVKFCIDGKLFEELVKRIKSEYLELIKNEDSISITSGKVKAELSINNDLLEKMTEYLINFDDEQEFYPLPEKFFTGLKLCSFSTDKNTANALSNVFISDNYIYSTDNFRLSIFNMSVTLQDDFNLSIKVINELLKYKFENYFIKDDFIYFFNDTNLIFSVRLNELTGKDFTKFVSFFDEKDFIEIPVDVNSLLDISSIILTEDNIMDKYVNIEIKDKKIKVTGKSELGIIENEIDFDIEVELNFSINPIFFQEILKICNKLTLKDNLIIFSNNEFLHLFSIKN